MDNLFWLTDAQMARLQPFFPKSHGKPKTDDRRVLSEIIFINRDLSPYSFDTSFLLRAQVMRSPWPIPDRTAPDICASGQHRSGWPFRRVRRHTTCGRRQRPGAVCTCFPEGRDLGQDAAEGRSSTLRTAQAVSSWKRPAKPCRRTQTENRGECRRDYSHQDAIRREGNPDTPARLRDGSHSLFPFVAPAQTSPANAVRHYSLQRWWSRVRIPPHFRVRSSAG
jgi:hypothetical protein